MVAKPLYDLVRKDAVFTFSEIDMRGFEALKRKLMEARILRLDNPHHETELHCDASAAGFGVVLMRRKSDGKFHPVMNFRNVRAG